MKYEHKDCLNALLTVPQRTCLDMRAIPVKRVAPQIKGLVDHVDDTSTLAHPEKEALRFYLLNHLVLMIQNKFGPNQPLPEMEKRVVEEYVKCLTAQSNRVMAYLMLITVRESRHAGGGNKSSTYEKIKAAKGEAMAEFWSEIPCDSSGAAANKLASYKGDLTLGELYEGTEWIFKNCYFKNSYGGLPWANITACLNSMLSAKTSLEMMVDSSYTLAHNNGPMFNKGMLYYSQNTDLLMRILDIQRSGQIPELYHGKKHGVSGLVTPEFDEFFQKYEIGKTVDWLKVMELGAVHDYQHYMTYDQQVVWSAKQAGIAEEQQKKMKAEQKAKAEHQQKLLEIAKKEEAEAKAKAQAEAEKKAMEEQLALEAKYKAMGVSVIGQFKMAPHVFIPIIKLDRSAA